MIVEVFHLDQPCIPGTNLSYTCLISIIMFIVGIFMLLVRYQVIRLPFLKLGLEAHQISSEMAKEEIQA